MSGCSAQVTEPYALRVLGDSMLPEFQHGHIVIVDPGGMVRDGAFIVVDYGGEVILGRLAVDGERRRICYLNEGYPALDLNPPYEIKGVVIQRVGRRRKDRKYYE